MTDPTSTRAEVETLDRAVERLRALHDYAGRPAWDEVVREELGAAFQALRERAEAAERLVSEAEAQRYKSCAKLMNRALEAEAALTAARCAEAAAWNAAIDAVEAEALPHVGPGARETVREIIRALRRAAPTEDRCATCGGDCGQC